MKKIIFIGIIALILLTGGCWGGKKIHPSKIVVNQIFDEGAILSMSEIRAQNSVEFTITRAILTLPCVDWVTGKTTKIEAYLYDDLGNIIETPIDVTKPDIVQPYTDCWHFLTQNGPDAFGAYGDFYADVPGGIGLCRLEAMGVTLDLPLLVYQTWKNLSQNTGVASGIGTIPGGNNIFHVSNTESDCFLWNDSTDIKKIILKGKSYFVADQPNHWYDCPNFVDLKTVDQEQINSGVTDRILDYNKIYCGEVPGGYVKLFYTYTFPGRDYMRVCIFEFSSDGNFL